MAASSLFEPRRLVASSAADHDAPINETATVDDASLPVPIDALFRRIDERPEAPKKLTRKRAREEAERLEAGDDDGVDAKKKLVGKARRTGKSHLHPKGPRDLDDERRTVFVGNLPNGIAKADVEKAFKDCGPISSVRLRSIQLQPEADGKNRGRGVRVLRGELLEAEGASCNAFIVFEALESVEKAVAKSGSVIKGRHVSVSRESVSDKAFDPRTAVFLGNLPREVFDEEVWSFFHEHDIHDVQRVRVIRDRDTNLAKGIAYVEFKSPKSVGKALALRQETIRKRPIRVCHVMKSRNPEVKAPSRRAIRQQQQASSSGAVGPIPAAASNKPKAVDKTSDRREAAATVAAGQDSGEAAAWWMGNVTNPRKKLAKDLRVLTMNDMDRKKMLRKKAIERSAQGKGGGPKKKDAKKDAKKAGAGGGGKKKAVGGSAAGGKSRRPAPRFG